MIPFVHRSQVDLIQVNPRRIRPIYLRLGGEIEKKFSLLLIALKVEVPKVGRYYSFR